MICSGDRISGTFAGGTAARGGELVLKKTEGILEPKDVDYFVYGERIAGEVDVSASGFEPIPPIWCVPVKAVLGRGRGIDPTTTVATAGNRSVGPLADIKPVSSRLRRHELSPQGAGSRPIRSRSARWSGRC